MAKQVLIQFKEDLKTFTLDNSSVSDILNKSRENFKIHENTNLKLKFNDEDNDLITITLDEELADALNSQHAETLLFILEAQGEASQATDVQPPQGEVMEQQQQEQPPLQEQQQEEEEQQQQPPQPPQPEPQSEQQQEPQEEELTEDSSRMDCSDQKDSEKIHRNEDVDPSDRARQVTNIEYITNEFQYHRLIVQTAVQTAFENLRKNYKEKTQPALSKKFSLLNEKKDIIFEAVSTTVVEWRQSVQNSLQIPSPQDIANNVSNALREAGHLAAPVIESIRNSIFKILDSLFGSTHLAVTEAEIEAMANSAVAQSSENEEIKAQAEHELKNEKEMEKIMMDLNTKDSYIQDQEVHVASTLNEDGFLLVENYRANDDPSASQRERGASLASEVLWEAPKEETDSTSQTVIVDDTMSESYENLSISSEVTHIIEMGFSDEAKIKSLLVKHNGDIQLVVNELLS